MPTTPPPQKTTTPSFALSITNKGVERLGKRQLWLVVTALRGLGSPTTGAAVREALRNLSVFISDDEYAEMCTSCGGADMFDLDVFFQRFFSVFSPRRRHAVDLVVAKLDPNKTGAISFRTLDREYDVLRHPSVVSGLREADDVIADFFDALIDPRTGECGDALSTEALMAYLLGVSTKTPSDENFELMCIRAFCLDRPRFNANEEVEQLAGSRAHSRQSRLLGLSKTNPLYATCNAEYGKNISNNKDSLSRPQYGRSQKFTKSAPGHTSTATSMNM